MKIKLAISAVQTANIPCDIIRGRSKEGNIQRKISDPVRVNQLRPIKEVSKKIKFLKENMSTFLLKVSRGELCKEES